MKQTFNYYSRAITTITITIIINIIIIIIIIINQLLRHLPNFLSLSSSQGLVWRQTALQ